MLWMSRPAVRAGGAEGGMTGAAAGASIQAQIREGEFVSPFWGLCYG